MCNLYSQTKAREALIRLFRVSDNRAAAFDPLPAIFPGHNAPVVRLADDGARELSILSWGFVLPQQGKAAKRVTNARDEKVRVSNFWRSSFEQRRCLVPVTSFSEPKGKATHNAPERGRAGARGYAASRQYAIWHWFGLKGDEPRPPFAFAGIWRSWKGPLKQDGEPIAMDVFAFLTTTPNEIVKPIHPTRMPVMLHGDDQFEIWLNGPADEAFSLARPYPADAMQIVHHGEKQDAA